MLARRKTVVCTSLQNRYGGKIVLHGPDASLFDPARFDPSANLRKKYGLPQYARLLLFAGKPVFYNGLPFLIDALLRPGATQWQLVLAGNPENPLFIEAKNKLGDRCHLLGFIPNERMPEVVKLADVVPIIQSLIPTTQMQIPAKLLEAMSMAKGIIGTRVCDIPLLLADNRGWVIEPGDTIAFLNILDTIDKNPELLDLFGAQCRSYYIKHASIEAIAEIIKPLLLN
jgi:glycosyltransferase involved in cell wall biosynthesis